MKVFLDFDDVIFNTKEFLVFLKSIFKKFGVSEALFAATYQEMRDDANGKDFCYSFDKHLEKLKTHLPFDYQELKKALCQGIADTRPFVFPDTKGLLEFLQEKQFEVDILSFGDQEYQTAKIKNAGLGELVKNILVTQESKEKILERESLSGENTWFFDDRAHFLENMKKAYPFMKTVLVSRPEGRFQDEKNKYCDYQIFNLEEAKELVRSV